MIMQYLKKLMKGEIPFSHVKDYIVGNLRYKLYYSKMFSWLMRSHIREQIDFRIEHMDKQCYEEGSCKMCGCTTTALQMCYRECDKPCYPRMMNKKEWSQWKMYLIFIDKGRVWFIDEKDPDKILRNCSENLFKGEPSCGNQRM